jgi:hypothetical protein
MLLHRVTARWHKYMPNRYEALGPIIAYLSRHLRQYSQKTFSSLYVRNYRLYYIGQIISTSDTFMQSMAQAWLVCAGCPCAGAGVGRAGCVGRCRPGRGDPAQRAERSRSKRTAQSVHQIDYVAIHRRGNQIRQESSCLICSSSESWLRQVLFQAPSRISSRQSFRRILCPAG